MIFVEDVASISWINVLFVCFIALIEIRRYKLTLEVKGGHNYFRFVEGTCIIACVLSSSVLYIYPLHIDSEPEDSSSERERRSFQKHNSTPLPLLVVFLTFNLYYSVSFLFLKDILFRICNYQLHYTIPFFLFFIWYQNFILIPPLG